MGPMVGTGRSARLTIARGKPDIDRFGSKAALTAPKRDFRFAPINKHQTPGSVGPFRARR